jgi:hypothetical protein
MLLALTIGRGESAPTTARSSWALSVVRRWLSPDDQGVSGPGAALGPADRLGRRFGGAAPARLCRRAKTLRFFPPLLTRIEPMVSLSERASQFSED